MTALSANKTRVGVSRPQDAIQLELQAGDSITLYQGAIAMRNSAGKIVVGADTASCEFAGIVREKLVTVASNTEKVKLDFGHIEEFPFDGTDFTIADLFENAFIKDSGTLTNKTTASNDVKVGRIVGWRAGYVAVQCGVFGATDTP
jgi:hypothetical protein